MSLWQFSESSQTLLKQCIEASNIDNNNKWIQKFGIKSKTDITESNEIANAEALNDRNSEDTTVLNPSIEIIDEDTITYQVPDNLTENFCHEMLDLDPVTHFDYIVEKCIEKPNALLMLANELPLMTIEKLSKHIYDSVNINSNFIEHFYAVFLPAFVKREPNRISLDLIVKSKRYPKFIKQLIVTLLKDVELPSNILYDYVVMLDIDECTELLITLSQSDIENAVFIHNLAAIYIAYKNCQNNNNIQNYILMKLIDISQYCVVDKNYGRFLLSFLQSQKDFPTDIKEMDSIIDCHQSAFKKPCFKTLKDIKKEM